MSERLEKLIDLIQDGVEMKVAMESTVATSIASHNAGVLGMTSPNVDTLPTKKPDEVSTDEPEDKVAKEVKPTDTTEVDDEKEKSESYMMMNNPDQSSHILAKRKHMMATINEAMIQLNQVYSDAESVYDIVDEKDMINFCIDTISDKLWKLRV